MTDIVCPRCDRPVSTHAFLAAAVAYWRETDSGTADCPACHQSVEFRVRPGAIEVGFTYSAGALHFDSVASYPVRGLRVASTPGLVEVFLAGHSFRIGPGKTITSG